MGHLLRGSRVLLPARALTTRRRDDWVLKHSQLSNLDLHDISWSEKHLWTTGIAHATWSARGDDVPWLQRHDLRDVGKRGGNVENKVARVGLLHHLAIEPQGHIEGMGVANFISSDQRRANRP